MPTDADKLLPGLARHSRVDLGVQPTPIEPLHRLGEKLGIKLFVKRDDTATLAMGGNKVRQLEYYLGPAKEIDADTVLITGAVQSNFTRLCTAAANKLGWHAVVQLEDRVPKDDFIYNHSGNVLLNQLLGAELHYFPEGENETAADANLDNLAEELTSRGHTPYVIHLGIDHPPLGGLGYAQCAAECLVQLQDMQLTPDHIVIPSGSGLTHGGFLAGARSIDWQIPVHGICVRRDATQQHARILQRTREIATLLGEVTQINRDDVLVDDQVLHPGYGQLNSAVMTALTEAAQLEALLLDPVYSGRTMAGLISLAKRKIIKQDESVLFIHTGGLPALFAYQKDLAKQLQNGEASLSG